MYADERRAKPSMANLNVYESKKSSADRQLHGGKEASAEEIQAAYNNYIQTNVNGYKTVQK